MKVNRQGFFIVAAEVAAFTVVLLVVWLDEFIDFPHLYLGAPATPYRIEEYLFETGTMLLAAAVVIGFTLWMLRRIRRLETFFRVCAWCRKVWIGDRWVRFEEYMAHTYSMSPTHGICTDCAKSVASETLVHGAQQEPRST